jgi:Cu2+-containing amine oxidase
MAITQNSPGLAQSAVQHPLEPLTAAEVQAAVTLIQAKKK